MPATPRPPRPRRCALRATPTCTPATPAYASGRVSVAPGDRRHACEPCRRPYVTLADDRQADLARAERATRSEASVHERAASAGVGVGAYRRATREALATVTPEELARLFGGAVRRYPSIATSADLAYGRMLRTLPGALADAALARKCAVADLPASVRNRVLGRVGRTGDGLSAERRATLACHEQIDAPAPDTADVAIGRVDAQRLAIALRALAPERVALLARGVRMLARRHADALDARDTCADMLADALADMDAPEREALAREVREALRVA